MNFDPNAVMEKEQNVQSVSPNDIAVAVVTFKGRQEQTVPAIKDTWGSDFPIIEYVSATAQDGIITAAVHDNAAYARTSWEEMNALKILYENYPYSPWYMKVDDDAYVNVNVLLQALSGYDPRDEYYLGQPLTYNNNDNHGITQYCAGGVGYVISNSAMKKIYHRLLEPIESCCSDVQIGKLLTEELNTENPCKPMDGVIYLANHLSLHMVQQGGEQGNLRIHSAESEDAKYVILNRVVGYHYVNADMQYALRLLYKFSATEKSTLI